MSERRVGAFVQSTLGGRIGRSIDRSWPGFVRDLSQRWSSDHAPPLSDRLAREILVCSKVLSCAVPRVQVVMPGCDPELPVILPMSSANGLDLRLWVDVQALEAMPSPARAFWLGHALGHLQCGHGLYFAMRMRMQLHGESSTWQWLLPLLRRAARLMVFSADRAGAGCCASIEAAADLMCTDQAQRIQQWLGQSKVPTPLRLAALEDFGQSASFSRMCALGQQARSEFFPPLPPQGPEAGAEREPQSQDPFRRMGAKDSVAPPPDSSQTGDDAQEPAPLWSLARCDQRLTQGLGMY